MKEQKLADIDHVVLVEKLLPVARQAGEAIMEIYRSGVEIGHKGDGSPVTEADRRAEHIILEGLRTFAPDIAIVSEENAQSHNLKPPQRYFLVDPLDGTREFIKADGRGSFTVNIALIENASPKLGIVFAPALGDLYQGIVGQGAWLNGKPISTRHPPDTGMVALASRSHRDAQTDAWIAANKITDTISIGSSLKFCLIARGDADIYPRFGPTMEWDTAAGHAVLSSAGGDVVLPDGQPFFYGKPEYRNGSFIANGGVAA